MQRLPFDVGDTIKFTEGLAKDRFADIVSIEMNRVTYNLYGWKPKNPNGDWVNYQVGKKYQYYKLMDDTDLASAVVVIKEYAEIACLMIE
jgi:hypothetical protein